MYIKKFSSRQFAGLKDIGLDFDRGLNVIVGANETGKSTVVNALFAVLFIGSFLKKSRADHREFLAQFMPHPSGDFIDGKIKLGVDDREYIISRQWGHNYGSSLTKPDGSMITSENEIDGLLQSIFILGPRTYQNIVFARQSQLKEMLDRLRERETIHSVSYLLREAVMNLDGISIDHLRTKIDAQLEELLKRWDFDNNRPQDTRVYKTGLGAVLSSYYRRENLNQQMRQVFALEQELHGISEELHQCEAANKVLFSGLKQLEPLEEDIVKRAELEPRLNALKKQSTELRAISLEWPRLENEYQTQETMQTQFIRQRDQIRTEENACLNRREYEVLARTIKRIDENRLLLGSLYNERQAMTNIGEDDVKKIEELNRSTITAQTAMKAGKIWASIHTETEVWVTRDLEPEARLTETQTSANGYMKIRLNDLAEIELKSGEFDFNQIKEDYLKARDALEIQLKTLGVKDLEEARYHKAKLDEINKQIFSIDQLITNLLAGQDYEGLKTRLQTMAMTDSTRSLAVIQSDKENTEEQLIKIKARLMNLKAKLEEWSHKYGSQNHLLDSIIACEMSIRETEADLTALKPLPPGIENVGQFRQQIKKLRDDLQRGETAFRELWKTHDAREREMPEDSYEDLKLQYEAAEKDLAQNLSRAKKLMRIKATFEETLTEMDSNSLQPLINSFSRYLQPTTRGRYKLGSFGEDFALNLMRDDEVGIPVNLLSSGTYDSVALSLRFALLDHIFAQGNGFVVLDDCLVDLDAERKQAAVEIIKEYAGRNQVIFTTCSNDTAACLGGKIIRL